MDKYTVDLDQVLNDFEYSELTDQHGFDQAKPNNRQNSAANYLHNNFKNTNVKHSINNVFHSLNEYLNTDISSKCDAKPLLLHPNPAGENSKRVDNNHSELEYERSKLTQSFGNDARLEEITNQYEQNSRQDEIEFSRPELATELIKSDIKLPELESEQFEQNNELEPIEIYFNYNELHPKPNQPHPKPSELQPKPSKLISKSDELSFNSNEQSKPDELIVELHANSNEPCPSPNRLQTVSIELHSNTNEIHSDSNLREELHPNRDEHELDTKQCELDVINSEQDHKLSEQDLEQQQMDVNLVEPSTFCPQNQNNDDSIDTQSEQETSVNESEPSLRVSDDVENDAVHEEQVVACEINQESISNNKEAEKSEEPVVTKVGFNNDIDLDDTELEKYLDDLESEFDAPKNEEDKSEETVVECNSVGRPNNLELPQQESGDAKPVIDLVGEPGSTPYNNVYVNKELPQEKKDSDTECSTSASPTFSDISTETNSSCTPSTDTVNDEQQNVAVKQDGDAPIGEVQTPPADGQVMEETASSSSSSWLGKQAPLWIPDAEATSCLHCDMKFTVIKRRHHCRACGYVLCSKCCGLKYRLEYLDDVARVCSRCYEILAIGSSGSESNSPKLNQPNPNNPLEYCSTVPPHQQVSGQSANPPAVMVPVGVLKRKGSNKSRTNKSVMFCDGIRPGSDLTNLDSDFSYANRAKKCDEVGKSFPVMDAETRSFIPNGEDLPPTVTVNRTEMSYLECSNGPNVVEMLRNEVLIFAIQTNFFVHVKIINMDCCINKLAWCFSTEGLINVGQDEIIILLEMLDDEETVPKDVFLHLNNVYWDAVKGTSVNEMGLTLHNVTNFLGSKNHAGFVYIRPTFQCLQNIIKPQEPYLIGILIHRWETPWAKLFPLRLVLRLGAECRYYPSPITSSRYRDSMFVEIGHTIINLLADFRNFSYTLPQIRGLTIHMEDKNTTVTIPSNRYDQVMKSMNNSSDHILAFAGNFSSQADSHLVCIQDTQSTENAYSTHAINIHNKPRKVTGASFIVFNGALKSSSGLTAKSSIVEDGLMIQIPSEHMAQIRDCLRNMTNHTIQCGLVNVASDETVSIVWGEPDENFNTNVFSPIDNKPLEGVPSIRVHNGKDYVSGNRLIRWTEVFIVQNENESSRKQDPVDISKVSETVAKATCTALVKYLDLLASNSFYKIGIRAQLNSYYVAYSAGSNAMKLPPIYMESLDNELVPVLHRNATSEFDENTIILELIFRILNKQ